MSEVVERLLENYWSLTETENLELREMKLDLDAALEAVDFTSEELTVLSAYLSPPAVRIRTGIVGRPSGGEQISVVATSGMPFRKVSRRFKSAAAKLAAHLGESYE